MGKGRNRLEARGIPSYFQRLLAHSQPIPISVLSSKFYKLWLSVCLYSHWQTINRWIWERRRLVGTRRWEVWTMGIMTRWQVSWLCIWPLGVCFEFNIEQFQAIYCPWFWAQGDAKKRGTSHIKCGQSRKVVFSHCSPTFMSRTQ